MPLRAQYDGPDNRSALAAELPEPGPWRIGRDPGAAIPIDDLRVSRSHAQVTFDAGVWRLEDTGSRGGLWLPNAHAPSQVIEIDRSLRVHLGAPDGPVLTLTPDTAPQATSVPSSSGPAKQPRPRGGARHSIRIGRDQTNDVVLDELTISRFHAEITQTPGGSELVDKDSFNGTFLHGRRVTREPIAAGERFAVSSIELVFDGASVARLARDEQAIGVEAEDLVVVVDNGTRILEDVSFTVRTRSLVAVVGPTGSGKSTLLKALTGIRPPDGGTVYVSERDLYRSLDELRLDIGYVPQDDLVHPRLTVRQALTYGAELRFAPDTSPAERTARVNEVMSELGLTERADVLIERLSGGQRKRTSVALELLTKPRVLFLDEPTSGLDPGYEKRVMQILRDLADAGQTVIVVTHAMDSLGMCDAVLFMRAGGRLGFYGPPESAASHFGVSDYPELFERLAATETLAESQGQGSREARTSGARQRPVGSLHARPAGRRNPTGQTATLVRRQSRILFSDRRNIVVLALAAVVPALLMTWIVGANALDLASAPHQNALFLIAALVITSACLGGANGLREIVKEQAIYGRERAVGLHRSAYVASKLLFLGAITLIQSIILVLIGTVIAGGPSAGNALPGRLELGIDVALVGVVTLIVGLALSALVDTSEKAMALIPVIFVVSFLFSGAMANLQQTPAIRYASYVVPSNWGMSAAASTSRLAQLQPCPSTQVGASGNPAGVATCASSDSRWEHRTPTWAWDVGALVALGVIASAGIILALRRREKRPAA